MEIALDENRGKSIGSHIRLAGRILGIPLAVEEVVTERNPPCSKLWKTVGSPRLLVIGSYRMGFEITSKGNASLLRVVIDQAQRAHRLATTGPYAKVRQPQYDAFVLIMFGFLMQWPTILTLAMFPVLVLMYLRLARRESGKRQRNSETPIVSMPV